MTVEREEEDRNVDEDEDLVNTRINCWKWGNTRKNEGNLRIVKPVSFSPHTRDHREETKTKNGLGYNAHFAWFQNRRRHVAMESIPRYVRCDTTHAQIHRMHDIS